MSASLRIDVASSVPPFEQIRAQVSGHIAAGDLRPGDRLPTVRDLASDLGIAVGTVQRAYRELETQGLIVSRRRHGTAVAAHGATTASPSPATEDVRILAQRLAAEAAAAGMSLQQLTDLVQVSYQQSPR
ncbi:MAG TPA: GntR family transcriptional regulator [Arachnia sp.]|nr:GntR family transcriptional regulator [Arachnia sp.]HMT85580.1 GntR family transcriptional regulator [Arachnia sp.]